MMRVHLGLPIGVMAGALVFGAFGAGTAKADPPCGRSGYYASGGYTNTRVYTYRRSSGCVRYVRPYAYRECYVPPRVVYCEPPRVVYCERPRVVYCQPPRSGFSFSFNYRDGDRDRDNHRDRARPHDGRSYRRGGRW